MKYYPCEICRNDTSSILSLSRRGAVEGKLIASLNCQVCHAVVPINDFVVELAEAISAKVVEEEANRWETDERVLYPDNEVIASFNRIRATLRRT